MMIKKVSDIDQVTKLLNKPEEDDSDVYFCKSLTGRLKSLPAKKNRLTRIKIEEVLFNLEFQ